MTELKTFDYYESIVDGNDADIGLAEAHGVLTGMVCVSDQVTPEAWLGVVFDSPEKRTQLAAADVAELEIMFAATAAAVEQQVVGLELMLPDDAMPLSDRVESLGEWCQGFLFGLGAVTTIDNWSRESQEILVDLLEITKIESQEGGEEDEAAFMEITEYVRVAVQLLHANFRLENKQSNMPPNTH